MGRHGQNLWAGAVARTVETSAEGLIEAGAAVANRSQWNVALAAGGVSRPVRFLTPDGAHVPGLECRAIRTADGWLAYANNLDRRNEKQLKLATGLELSRVRNLTMETDSPLSFTVPGGETYILRLNANQGKSAMSIQNRNR